MSIPEPLKPEQLYTKCDPAKINLDQAALASTDLFSVGQERAIDAIRFGVGIKRTGFNIFAYGAPGTGKHSLVRQHLDEVAAKMPVPDDWCYVHNFEETHKPKAISLPAGKGCALRNTDCSFASVCRGILPPVLAK